MCARVCVCLFICVNILCASAQASVFHAPFLCKFWRLHIQFKRLFSGVCLLTMHLQECVCACALFTTLTSPPPQSPPSAPPYLSPMEMHWGQGIWGEEHREAALRNLKGILMNQHSRADYSHDNRPQTNSSHLKSPRFMTLKMLRARARVCVCVHACGCFCFPSTV